MKALNASLGRFASFAPLFLRIILGGLFLLHGIDKFNTGLSNVEGFFASNGVPLAGLTAPLTAVAEIVLGIALIIGLATRLSATVSALIMFGAIIWVTADGGILGGAEINLAYISGLLALVLVGPGRFSADEAMKTDETVIDLRAANEASAHTPVGV